MSLTVKDAEKLRDLFNKVDADHNGCLDKDEFKHFLDEADEE